MKQIIPYRILFVSIVILVVAFGCSRFEDGPKMSLRSVEKRICGTYRIDYFSKNGTDLTDYWSQYYNLTFTFSISETSGIENTLFIQIDGVIDSLGIWKDYYGSDYGYFDNSDEVTILMYNCVIDTTIFPPERLLYPLVTNFQDSAPIKFSIKHLTNKEMWLYYKEGYDVYEIRLKENI